MLTHWEPFNAMRTIEREFDDLVNRFFSTSSLDDGPGWVWRPAMEVFRDEDRLVARAELPGIDPEKDVEVSIEGNILHIKGERSFDKEISDERRYLIERAYGEFRRDVILPEGVDADEMKATYADGVLTVTVPLPESMKQAEPRKIPVAVSKVKKLLGGKRDAA